MTTNVDAILAEMESIGAVGAPKAKPLAQPVVVEEVEVEQASPGPVLKDVRGEQMTELLDSVIAQLEVLQGTFRTMRQIWQTEDVPDTGDRAERVLQAAKAQLGGKPTTLRDITVSGVAPTARERAAARGSARGTLPGDLVPAVPTPPPATEAEARARALAKIRGVADDDDGDKDDGVPYVGQDRAMPPSATKGNDEVTLRSIPVTGKE